MYKLRAGVLDKGRLAGLIPAEQTRSDNGLIANLEGIIHKQ